MSGIGMFSWFSYDLPIIKRLQLIKNAGFDVTSLWWHGDKKHEQPDITRKIDYFTLEVDFNREHDKCKQLYGKLSAKEYLDLAYAKANKLLKQNI